MLSESLISISPELIPASHIETPAQLIPSLIILQLKLFTKTLLPGETEEMLFMEKA